MTGREYRQDDRTDGYCPQCGEPLSAMTTGARGLCEVHGWQYADWTPNRRPSDRDPGDETDAPDNLTPGVTTGEENDR